MRLPDFLIIGAMKAGTTSLYRDLEVNPLVFVSTPKEPHNLLRDDVFTDAGRRAYAELFARARPDQQCAEASTGYTKLPTHPGVAARAARLLGSQFRAVYLVREPVSRTLSHHFHVLTAGEITERDAGRAIEQHPEMVEYSRYGMQVQSWLEEIGTERLMVVRFEDYVADRRGWTARISEFVGVAPRPDLVQVEEVFNKGDEKPVPKGPAAALRRLKLYKAVRPLIPMGMRDRMRQTMMPKAEARPAPPAPAVVDRLIDTFERDGELLRTLLGDGAPQWDFARVRAKLAAPAEATA